MTDYNMVDMMTAVPGAWSVEITMQSGVIWNTPVIGWVPVLDALEPVIADLADNYASTHKSLVTLSHAEDGDPGTVFKLLLDGEDPWHQVHNPYPPYELPDVSSLPPSDVLVANALDAIRASGGSVSIPGTLPEEVAVTNE